MTTEAVVILRRHDCGRHSATVRLIGDWTRPAAHRMCYEGELHETPAKAEADALAFAEWKGLTVVGVRGPETARCPWSGAKGLAKRFGKGGG